MMRCFSTTGILACAVLIVSTTPLSSQALEWGGEIRPRFEFRSPDGFSTDPSSAFTSMRARASLRAALERDVTVFLQFQDVRIWGSETSTTDGAADMFDLHQGWVELGDPVAGGHALRLGRQELAYGEERLVGALDWVQQARSFDGGRYRFRRPDRNFTADFFAMRLSEDEVFLTDASFLGVYATLVDVPAGAIDGYALYHTVGDDVTDQTTLGGRWAAARDAIDWRIEAAFQTGQRAGQDLTAYMLAVRAGTMVTPRLRADLWYDLLSGDDDPTDERIRVFDTLFATNHKFYGIMDLFTNIPVHTGGRGLQDLALKTRFAARPDVDISADVHAFFLAADEGVDSSHLGEEIDLVARWAYTPAVGLSGGLAFFIAGGAWPDPDQTMSFLYLMLDVRF